MGRSLRLQRQYEELNERYSRLFAEKAELEYTCSRLQRDAREREQQDEEIRKLHQGARRLKHDMKNHFMVLSSYLSTGDYDAARAYSSEILDKLNTMNSYVETGNALLNHIVNDKFQAAREKGIQVKAEIENLAFARMSSMDFSAMLTNLLDNAMEASVREREGSRELVLLVSRRQGYEAVCIKNKIARSVLAENPELGTAKERDAIAHGVGIASVKEIVEGYNGIYDIYEADGYFCVSVFIPQ